MPESKTPCPICERASQDFEALNRQINQAGSITDKAHFAQKLIAKVKDVLEEHGQEDNPATKACRSVLSLREQTAELILKFQKLAD